MKLNQIAYCAAVCRWFGRIIGMFLFATVVLLAIGEGLPNVFTQPVGVQAGFLALGLILAGILGGWKWELAGGAVSLFGWAVFVLAEIRPLSRLNWFIGALALPGILYLISALLRRRQGRHLPQC